jgi:hypothetical protein
MHNGSLFNVVEAHCYEDALPFFPGMKKITEQIKVKNLI